MITPWIEERIDAAKLYVEQGMSCAQIAEALGDTTRNAVCGKLFRLGIQTKNEGGFQKTRRSPRPRKSRILDTAWGSYSSRTKAPQFFDISAAVAEPLHVSFMLLNTKACRWPYGEGPFTFCGCETLDGPYCFAHKMQSIGKGTTSERLAAYAPKEAVA